MGKVGSSTARRRPSYCAKLLYIYTSVWRRVDVVAMRAFGQRQKRASVLRTLANFCGGTRSGHRCAIASIPELNAAKTLAANAAKLPHFSVHPCAHNSKSRTTQHKAMETI